MLKLWCSFFCQMPSDAISFATFILYRSTFHLHLRHHHHPHPFVSAFITLEAHLLKAIRYGSGSTIIGCDTYCFQAYVAPSLLRRYTVMLCSCRSQSSRQLSVTFALLCSYFSHLNYYINTFIVKSCFKWCLVLVRRYLTYALKKVKHTDIPYLFIVWMLPLLLLSKIY